MWLPLIRRKIFSLCKHIYSALNNGRIKYMTLLKLEITLPWYHILQRYIYTHKYTQLPLVQFYKDVSASTYFTTGESSTFIFTLSVFSGLRLALVTLAFSVLMARAFHCAVLAISSDMFTTEGSVLKNKHTFWLVFHTLQHHCTYCHSSFTSVVPLFNIYAATSWVRILQMQLNKNVKM